MAREVRQFSVKCAANTGQGAAVTTDLGMPARVVRSITVRIPPGPRGTVGFTIGAAGTQLIPLTQGEWIVADDEVLTWELDGYITSGAWQLTMYNTGQYIHEVQVRFELDMVSAPAEAVTLAAPLSAGAIEGAAGLPMPSVLPGGGGLPMPSALPPEQMPPEQAPPTGTGTASTGWNLTGLELLRAAMAAFPRLAPQDVATLIQWARIYSVNLTTLAVTVNPVARADLIRQTVGLGQLMGELIAGRWHLEGEGPALDTLFDSPAIEALIAGNPLPPVPGADTVQPLPVSTIPRPSVLPVTAPSSRPGGERSGGLPGGASRTGGGGPATALPPVIEPHPSGVRYVGPPVRKPPS